MCGIFAYWSVDRPLDDASIARSLKALYHRGPDDRGIWQNQNKTVTLAHTRLAIMDPMGGRQPISNEHGDIIAVVNGELYNYKKLKNQLESRGHQFRSRSDSELLCHLYEEYGIDCLQYLDGEFSFVLWDTTAQRLFLARDRFGVKPLYWSKIKGNVHIASEEHVLFTSGVPANWNLKAYATACTIQYVSDNQSLYESVHSLQPAHYLTIDSGGIIQEKQYWTLTSKPEYLESYEESCNILNTTLRRAIAKRLQSDVPICAQLSGGIDSCAVAALASEIQGSALDCFTVSFEDQLYDEYNDAHYCADFMGSNHHRISVSHRDLIDHFADAVIAGGGVAINGHISAKYLLSRVIQKHGYKVVITGEGSDEVLFGYPHLRQDLRTIPASQDIHKQNKASQGLMVATGVVSESLQKSLSSFTSIPNFIRAKHEFGSRLQSLFYESTPGWPNISLEQYLLRYCQQLPSFFDLAPIRQSAFLWSKMALGTYILRTLGDRMEMAHSIEGRVPFLDHTLVEAVQRIPVSHLIVNGIEKAPLRTMLHSVIPERIRKKRKHPFVAPPLFCTTEPFVRNYLHDVIQRSAFEHLPFFNRDKIIARINSIPDMSDEERRYWDPVLTFIVSSIHIGKQYRL